MDLVNKMSISPQWSFSKHRHICTNL